MTDESGITLKMIMDHQQAMQYALQNEIRSVGKSVDGLEDRMDGMNKSLNSRIDRLETNLTRQIDGIDKRLDAIEIENLPRRVAVLEAAAR